MAKSGITRIAAGVATGGLSEVGRYIGGLTDVPEDGSAGILQQNVATAGALDKLLAGYGTEGVKRAQAMLDKWESTFGGLQENLSNYYKNLDPVKFSQQQKTAFSQNLNKQMDQLHETLTQRGMMSAGQRAQLDKEAAFQKAQADTSFDINAPEKVAQMQQGFVATGANQQSQANQAMNIAQQNQAQYATTGASAIMNARLGVAQNLQQQQQLKVNSNNAMLGAIGSVVGAGAGLITGGASTGAGAAV